MVHIAAVLLQTANTDFPALAGMLACIIGISSILGSLITKMLVGPMIRAATDQIVKAMVSKEVFDIYKAEHKEMKTQLAVLMARNHR